MSRLYTIAPKLFLIGVFSGHYSFSWICSDLKVGFRGAGMDFYKKIAVMVHCKEKIGDVWIVSEQLRIICRSIGVRMAQFIGWIIEILIFINNGKNLNVLRQQLSSLKWCQWTRFFVLAFIKTQDNRIRLKDLFFNCNKIKIRDSTENQLIRLVYILIRYILLNANLFPTHLFN